MFINGLLFGFSSVRDINVLLIFYAILYMLMMQHIAIIVTLLLPLWWKS